MKKVSNDTKKKKGRAFVMSIKTFKRILAVTMAASMLAMPLTVGATDSADSTRSDSSVTRQEAASVQTTSEVSDNGSVVQNELPGIFEITASPAVSGIAVRGTAAQIKQKAGLAGNESPIVRAYSVERKKSPAVYKSFDAAASIVGGKLVGGINVDLGKVAEGKYSKLPREVSVPATIGIKNYDPKLNYYVAKVVSGGAIELIPVTVEKGMATVDITGGLAGYGLIVK